MPPKNKKCGLKNKQKEFGFHRTRTGMSRDPDYKKKKALKLQS